MGGPARVPSRLYVLYGRPPERPHVLCAPFRSMFSVEPANLDLDGTQSGSTVGGTFGRGKATTPRDWRCRLAGLVGYVWTGVVGEQLDAQTPWQRKAGLKGGHREGVRRVRQPSQIAQPEGLQGRTAVSEWQGSNRGEERGNVAGTARNRAQ